MGGTKKGHDDRLYNPDWVHKEMRKQRERSYSSLVNSLDNLERMGQSSGAADAMRYQMEAQARAQQQVLDAQAMAVGNWYTTTGTTGTMTTFSEARAHPKEAWQDRFWTRDFECDTHRLDREKVYECLKYWNEEGIIDYHRCRGDRDYFDKMFGRGAWDQYTKKQAKPAPTTKQVAPRTRSWSLPKFVVGKDRSLVGQLKKDHSDSMAKKSVMFHVEHDENLFDALERHMCEWLKKPYIKADRVNRLNLYQRSII